MRIAKITFDETEALRLYRLGWNDTQIAVVLGVKWQDITKYRNRNKLSSNLKRRKPHEKISS